jgi:hypothetical protein
MWWNIIPGVAEKYEMFFTFEKDMNFTFEKDMSFTFEKDMNFRLIQTI